MWRTTQNGRLSPSGESPLRGDVDGDSEIPCAAGTTDYLSYVEGVLLDEAVPRVPQLIAGPFAQGLGDLSSVRLNHAYPAGADGYAVVGSVDGDANVYSIIADTVWGRVADESLAREFLVEQFGDDALTLTEYRPVTADFEAVFTPPGQLDEVVVTRVEARGL
jgi:hypothetical protein